MWWSGDYHFTDYNGMKLLICVNACSSEIAFYICNPKQKTNK